MLRMKFHSKPTYDKKYIKTKVKTFNGIVNTTFWNDEIPKENAHYNCIAVISTDFVMKVDKKSYPQVYLEKYKYETSKKGWLDILMLS